jgi:hypothetical protein
MNQDALERLRNRAKPTVEKRDSSLNSIVDKSKIDNNPDVITNEQKDIFSSSNRDVEISTIKELEKSPFKSERNGSNSSGIEEIKTKQSTIRLEKNLSQRLTQQCQEAEISREVFLEALFIYYEQHKSMQDKVLREARKRDGQRQKLANYRRAKSMIERFGDL